MSKSKPIRRASKNPDIITPEINNIYENHIKISPESKVTKMVTKKQIIKTSKEASKWNKLISNMDSLLDKRKTLNGKIKYVHGLMVKLSEADGLIQMTVGKHLDDVLDRLLAIPKPEKKKRQPKARKPKKISLRKYIRTVNYLLKSSGYELPVIKTIDNSENIATLAYCLELIFPNIVNYNIYKMTEDQIKYILSTIQKYIDEISQDEYQDIISRLDINEVTRTFPTKPSQAKLPILNDVSDIQFFQVYGSKQEESQSQHSDEEEEYPMVTMKDTIHYEKPYTKQVSKISYLKDEEDPADFFDTIEAQPKPQPKRRIPKYEPPENYKDQQDVYTSYETYGDYKNKSLVFETATHYIKDLGKIKQDIKYIDKEEFLKKLKSQISKPTSTVLFDYLYKILLPIHRRQYDISLIYDDNNDELVKEDEIIVEHLEAIDEMCDILARAQYSLDNDRYKQFLMDLSVILGGTASKQEQLDIVKNFYIKYKFISAPKMKELISTYGIGSYDKLIAQGDKYIQGKIDEEIELENKKQYKINKDYRDKQRKAEEAEEKRLEKEEMRLQKLIDKQMK